MPFIKPEEWELGIFDQYKFNEIIPLDDVTAYSLYRESNWIKFYNKIELCKSQGISSVIHGMPFKFPAFSKPIYSLYGLGKNSKIFNKWDEREYIGGNLLMPLLKGKQYSTDFVLLNGKIKWFYTMIPSLDENNLPVLWSYNILPNFECVNNWIEKNMKGYTGIINLETIGNNIIDFHLRMSSQFVTLYGDGWLDHVIKLYSKGVWNYNKNNVSGHSLVIWTNNSTAPNKEIIGNKKFKVQLTYEKGKRLDEIHNIGGWYRLAIVNWNNLY